MVTPASTVFCLVFLISLVFTKNITQLDTKSVTYKPRKLNSDVFGDNIQFNYHKNGQLTYIGTVDTRESLLHIGCRKDEKFAFLFHGWKESCDIPWMVQLIEKLTKYRGGCIVCVNYSKLAAEPYSRLLLNYKDITAVIVSKFRYLQALGFNPNNGYMFGFSFGGRLACGAGIDFGPGLFKEIDACDMAGPGFDNGFYENYNAAQNVQCIHTSGDKGTKNYNCHQNWRMGRCGLSQIGAKGPPKGSHGLCPYFYISSFENDFYAISKPNSCRSNIPAIFIPENFKMGYMESESRKRLVRGELFADTTKNYPYNFETILEPDIHKGISSKVREKLHNFRIKRS